MALFATWLRRAEVRRELAELAKFDDFMLRDIGLTREDVRKLRARR